VLSSAGTLNLRNLAGGLIEGGAGGTQGAGGAGIKITGGTATITNLGTISGGLAGATRANAIEFSGGGHTLILGAGSTLNGGVVLSSSGSGDVLRVNTGTATLNGSLNLPASATFRVDVTDNTTYGKLVVNGTATLPSNAKINVNAADPNFSFTATSLADVISATTLVSDGSFAVTDNSLLFNFSAVKDGNTVDLRIARATTVLTSVTNQSNTPATGAAATLDAIINSDPTGSIGSLFGRLTTEQKVSDATSQTLPLLTGDSAVATRGALSGINRVVQARIEGNNGLSSGDSFYGDKNVWLKPFGSAASQDDSGGVSGYKARVYGIAGGVDGTLSNTTRLGAAFAYANAAVDSNSANAPQATRVDVYQLIGYGSTSLDANTELSYQGGIGNNTNKGRRELSSFGLAADSSYRSQSLHAGIGLGRIHPMNETTSFTPTVRVDYTQVKDDGYTEAGAGVLNLVVNGRTSEQLIYALDGKITHTLSPATTLNVNLGVAYDAKAKQSSITAAYAGAPGLAFTTRGMNVEATTYRLGVGLVSKNAMGLEVTGRYDVEARAGYTNQTLSAKVRWAF